jgi:hypothetical protein
VRYAASASVGHTNAGVIDQCTTGNERRKCEQMLLVVNRVPIASRESKPNIMHQ